MDQGPGKPSSSKSRDSRRQRRSASTSNLNQAQNNAAQEQADGSGVSAQDAALLAQFAFAAENLDRRHYSMLSQGYYPSMAPLPGFYGNFVHHNNMPPPQSPPSTSMNYPWHTATTPPPPKPSTSQQRPPRASSTPRGFLHLSDAASSNEPGPSGQQPYASTSASASHNSSEPDVELTEAERVAASDEKRRRNTAASARFRIKKKHRTITLERTVSDLTGRAEELEREVGDLRRENGWLKEIVMLKGAQNIANNRLAFRQAVALATGQRTYGTESELHEEEPEESSESSELSEDDASVPEQSKGKQKSKSKKS